MRDFYLKTIKTDPSYSKHFFASACLFILGDAVITLPQISANEFTFLAFLISVFVSVLLGLLIFAIKNLKIVIFPIAFLAFYSVFDVFLTFIKFISQNLLPETPRFFIILPFVLISVYFCLKPQTAILKFSLISFSLCALLVVFFFFFTAKDFNIKNIYIYSLPSIKTLFIQIKGYLKSVTLPSVMVIIYARLINIEKKTAIGGLLGGNIFLGLCILNSVLLFGIALSAKIDYPYAVAISTVTFGNLFTRMDGFAYFIYFTSCLVKITVCTFIIRKALTRS